MFSIILSSLMHVSVKHAQPAIDYHQNARGQSWMRNHQKEIEAECRLERKAHLSQDRHEHVSQIVPDIR